MRKHARKIARRRMEKKIHKPCKKIAGSSYFSRNWREYA